jgi:hypothetical protein
LKLRRSPDDGGNALSRMLDPNLDREEAVLHLRPKGRLNKTDFEQLAILVDPFIEERGGLRGLIIETAAFPGWRDFPAMIAHLRFVREHHAAIARVALVTDSLVADFAEHLASHFVAAQIKHFRLKELGAARAWIRDGPARKGP